MKMQRFRARVRGNKTWYYYDAGGKPRKEIPLGCDYVTAARKWAELEGSDIAPVVVTFHYAADQYAVRALPEKAARTQRDNEKELKWLRKFFDDACPLDAITPFRVKQYIKWREPSNTRALREKALLSHLWNWSREEGYTALPNPCAGVKGKPSKGRDIYIEDDIYAAILQACDQPTREAMQLAYLTGQRPADTLRMSDSSIRNDIIAVRQGKTGTKLRIEVLGELESLLKQISQRKREFSIYPLDLIVSEAGKPITLRCLQDRWRKARLRAIKDPSNEKIVDEIKRIQFRDLRAKAGTDREESDGIRSAQKLLGHKNLRTTEHYVRGRRGAKVRPTR